MPFHRRVEAFVFGLCQGEFLVYMAAMVLFVIPLFPAWFPLYVASRFVNAKGL